MEARVDGRVPRSTLLRWLLVGLVLSLTANAMAFTDSARPEDTGSAGVQTLKVRSDVYMLTANGINITVQTGPQGTVVVDTGPAESAPAVLAAIRQVATSPIRYVIDTSADADLIGGNVRVAPAGESLFNSVVPGATIVAREGVIARLVDTPGGYARVQSVIPNEPFSRAQYNFSLNGQGVAVMWQPAAHSDVDLAVRFWRSDVVCTGALLDLTRFPDIDVAHGGSIDGEIEAINRLLNTFVIPPIPIVTDTGGTLVVPMRGPLADQADLVMYRDMLQDMRARVLQQIDHQRSLMQIEQSDVTQGYDHRFGGDGALTRRFIAALYANLTAPKTRR